MSSARARMLGVASIAALLAIARGLVGTAEHGVRGVHGGGSGSRSARRAGPAAAPALPRIPVESLHGGRRGPQQVRRDLLHYADGPSRVEPPGPGPAAGGASLPEPAPPPEGAAPGPPLSAVGLVTVGGETYAVVADAHRHIDLVRRGDRVAMRYEVERIGAGGEVELRDLGSEARHRIWP